MESATQDSACCQLSAWYRAQVLSQTISVRLKICLWLWRKGDTVGGRSQILNIKKRICTGMMIWAESLFNSDCLPSNIHWSTVPRAVRIYDGILSDAKLWSYLTMLLELSDVSMNNIALKITAGMIFACFMVASMAGSALAGRLLLPQSK